MRATLHHFIDKGCRHTSGLQRRSGAASRQNFEAIFDKALAYFNKGRLVFIFDRNKYRTRQRQIGARTKLAFGECPSKVSIDSHNFAG